MRIFYKHDLTRILSFSLLHQLLLLLALASTTFTKSFIKAIRWHSRCTMRKTAFIHGTRKSRKRTSVFLSDFILHDFGVNSNPKEIETAQRQTRRKIKTNNAKFQKSNANLQVLPGGQQEKNNKSKKQQKKTLPAAAAISSPLHTSSTGSSASTPSWWGSIPHEPARPIGWEPRVLRRPRDGRSPRRELISHRCWRKRHRHRVVWVMARGPRLSLGSRPVPVHLQFLGIAPDGRHETLDMVSCHLQFPL